MLSFTSFHLDVFWRKRKASDALRQTQIIQVTHPPQNVQLTADNTEEQRNMDAKHGSHKYSHKS